MRGDFRNPIRPTNKGFTLLYRKGYAPAFCQVSADFHSGSLFAGTNFIVLNLFEEFGTNGTANKILERLGGPRAFGLDIQISNEVLPVPFVAPVSPVRAVGHGLRPETRVVRYSKPELISEIFGLNRPVTDEYLGCVIIDESPAPPGYHSSIYSQVVVEYDEVVRTSV